MSENVENVEMLKMLEMSAVLLANMSNACLKMACLQCLQMPIAPAWAFNAGTLGFCTNQWLPELLLTLVYVILSTTIALVGGAAVDVTGYFGFAQVRCLERHCLERAHVTEPALTTNALLTFTSDPLQRQQQLQLLALPTACMSTNVR